MTFADLRQKLKNGEVSSKELVNEKLNRIKELDSTLNTFLTVNTDKALRKAEYIDKQITLLITSPIGFYTQHFLASNICFIIK